MRRLFWILAFIGCSTTKPHPDFLGDCAKQPCGAYIPGQGGSTATDAGLDVVDTGTTPPDAGFDVVDTGTTPPDSGTMTDAPVTDGTSEATTEDSGVLDAPDEQDP